MPSCRQSRSFTIPGITSTPPLVSDGVDLGMRRAPQGRDEEPRGSTPGYGVNIRQHEPRKGGPIVVSSI